MLMLYVHSKRDGLRFKGVANTNLVEFFEHILNIVGLFICTTHTVCGSKMSMITMSEKTLYKHMQMDHNCRNCNSLGIFEERHLMDCLKKSITILHASTD